MTRKQLRDPDRLLATVSRYFERMGQTEFPTVRRVSWMLRWSYARVLQAVNDDTDRLFTTSYHTTSEPAVGDHFVEIY